MELRSHHIITFCFIVLFFGAGAFAQQDSIRKQELTEIKNELDSLKAIFRESLKEVDSLQSAISVKDTLRMRMEQTDVNYKFGDQEVVLFQLNGYETADSVRISRWLLLRGVVLKRDFYLIQYSKNTVPLYAGSWDKDGYLGDVIEYGSDGTPIAVWKKTNGIFTRETLE